MTDASTKQLSLAEIRNLAKSVLTSAGMDDHGSDVLADIIMLSERDGPRSHGLRNLPAYVQSFTSGYANPAASPTVTHIAPGVLRGDADNGYYQIAARTARADLISLARENGIAAFTCANCHHLGALRFDTEPLAEQGLLAIAVINSLAMVVPHGGARPVFGTNPMAFACPREGATPIVWDLASSAAALLEVKLAAAEGHALKQPSGLDAQGQPTTDPNAILETRSMLPFGAHKGAAIAFMVEVLGAALAGGTLAVDNAEREAHDALNIKGGATLIALDPTRFGNPAYNDHITRICAEIEGNGQARVPGDGRLKTRADAEANGVPVSTDILADLDALRSGR